MVLNRANKKNISPSAASRQCGGSVFPSPNHIVRIMQINTKQALTILAKCIQAGLVPLLKGSPGAGKSSIVHALATQYRLKVIDLRLSQCDPTDLNV